MMQRENHKGHKAHKGNARFQNLDLDCRFTTTRTRGFCILQSAINNVKFDPFEPLVFFVVKGDPADALRPIL